MVCVFCSLTQHTETRFYTVADRCMQNNNKNNLGENWVATAPPLPQTFTPNPELVRLPTESKTGSVRDFVVSELSIEVPTFRQAAFVCVSISMVLLQLTTIPFFPSVCARSENIYSVISDRRFRAGSGGTMTSPSDRIPYSKRQIYTTFRVNFRQFPKHGH